MTKNPAIEIVTPVESGTWPIPPTSGISSVSDLHKLPIHAFKIDESFVQDINEDLMLRSLIQLAKVIDARLIASGVNVESTLSHLKELGCDEAEGIALYPALSPIEMTLLLARTKR